MIRNLLITLGLSFTLLLLGAFVFIPAGEAQSAGILPQLIDLPAPPPANPLVRFNMGERPAEFFNQKNPPADDAPIEDLLIYWERQNSLNAVLNHTIEPSPRVLERLLDEVEKNPDNIGNYLNVLARSKDAVDAVKRIYDRLAGNENEVNKYQAENLKQWLTVNSDYFSDELLQRAQQVRDTEEYITNQDDLLALARVDFEKARPLLDRLVSDSSRPASQTVARWAFYLNALKKGSSIEAGNYRDNLMKTVEDRNAKPGIRDLAFDAIVYGGDFPGLDDWYLKLMEDETLHDLKVGGATYTGLTTLLLRAPPDKYADKMIELLKSSNLAVRSAAVRNLTTVLKDSDERVVRALLPWLENPNWARETGSERITVVRALAQFEIPESVPGLIAVLNEKATVEVEDEDEDYSSNSNMRIYSNTNSGRARSGRMQEVFPLREAAVDALIRQKNPQAAAALRGVLPEVASWKRSDVVKAILVSGGFTIPEQVEALETTARELKAQQDQAASEFGVSPESFAGNRVYVGNASANVAYGSSSGGEMLTPADIKKMLGDQLTVINEPGNELVAAVSFRITALDRNEPAIAGIIRSFMQNWQGAAVNALLLGYLAEGKSDLNAVVRLLSARKDLRENQIGSIYDARSRGNPLALGIAACLLENNADYAGILASAADDTKIAMLGCARLIRAQLSLQAVAPYLKSPNKLLALAAERYIESEDSPAARQIIYALYPNEAKILGATYFFGEGGKTNVRPDFLAGLYGSVNNIKDLPPYYFYMMLAHPKDLSEEKLRKEVKADETLLGIYGYDKNYVRIYQDRAVFSWEEDEARYFERKLSDAEFGYLKSYLSSNDVNNLPPFVSYCGGCVPKELVMVGRQGGRRVFVFSNPQPQFFEGLEKIFEDMRKPPAALRYWLEKDIAGARILFADEDLQAVTVWKNGDDLRVLVNNTARQMEIGKELEKLARLDEENDALDYQKAQELANKRWNQRMFESFSWYGFAEDKLGDFVNQPVGVDFISPNNNFSKEFESESWSAKAGNVEVKTDGETLFKVIGGQTTKIQTGYYRNPVISANGRWVVLTKYMEDLEAVQIMRINLQTNREFAVKIDNKNKFAKPVADISATNKILVETNEFDYENRALRQPLYYLLNPDTGAIEPAKGEFRPFMQETFRKLQKAAKPDDVWAAIFDKGKNETQVGIFNEKTFVFTPVLNVPQISFDSMEMWVDESSNKVFIVYRGQLLSIPLRKEKSEPPRENVETPKP